MVRLFRGSSPRPIIEYLTTDNEEGVNWVKIGDVPTSGRIITSTEEKITKEGAKKSRHVYVGDLILSNSMSYGLPYIMGIEGCIHDGWFVLRDYEQNFNKDYLCNLLISDIVQKQYKKIAAGGVVQNISSDLVNSVYISIPSLDEQRKIAGLLSLIDERIATQNKIIEDLKKLKVCVRRLIFRTLNCSWFLLSELEASGDICFKRGNIIPKHEHTDIFCYPVYSSSVQNGGLMGYNNTYMFNTELVTWSIDGGGNFFYRHKHKFNVTNVSGYMQLNEAKYNYRFVSEILLWQHSFMVFDYQTKAHPSVIRSIYKLPDVSLAEQELIANIFRLLDVKLQNEMTILKQYQQQKQYLLRQMFI